MLTTAAQSVTPITSTSIPTSSAPCPGTSNRQEAVSTATSKTKASAARPAKPEVGSDKIFSRLMETPTNTSPVRTPAAPAWAKKKSCQLLLILCAPLRRPDDDEGSVSTPNASAHLTLSKLVELFFHALGGIRVRENRSVAVPPLLFPSSTQIF